ALIGTPAAVLGVRQSWRQRKRASWIVGAVGLVILAFYFVMGVPYFFWYTVIPVAGWAWLASIGLPEISRAKALYVALAIFVVAQTIVLRNLYGGRVEQEALSFRNTALALQQASGGRGSVFLEPIGHVGDVLKTMRVIDEVGLVAPRVAM